MASSTCKQCGRPVRPGQELCNRCIDREAAGFVIERQPLPGSLPGCVIVYAVLLLLGGLAGLCGGIFLFFSPIPPEYAQFSRQWRAMVGTPFPAPQSLMLVNAIISVASGLIYLLIATGLFLRQNWARWGIILLNGLNILFSLAPIIVIVLMPNIEIPIIIITLCAILPALLINGYIVYWFLFHGEYFARAPALD